MCDSGRVNGGRVTINRGVLLRTVSSNSAGHILRLSTRLTRILAHDNRIVRTTEVVGGVSNINGLVAIRQVISAVGDSLGGGCGSGTPAIRLSRLVTRRLNSLRINRSDRDVCRSTLVSVTTRMPTA